MVSDDGSMNRHASNIHLFGWFIIEHWCMFLAIWWANCVLLLFEACKDSGAWDLHEPGCCDSSGRVITTQVFHMSRYSRDVSPSLSKACVKELVENSLDAKATRIEVRLCESGSELLEARNFELNVVVMFLFFCVYILDRTLVMLSFGCVFLGWDNYDIGDWQWPRHSCRRLREGGFKACDLQDSSICRFEPLGRKWNLFCLCFYVFMFFVFQRS